MRCRYRYDGNGIAQTFAQAGHDVLLKGRSEASLGKAHKAIEKSLSKLVEKARWKLPRRMLSMPASRTRWHTRL